MPPWLTGHGPEDSKNKGKGEEKPAGELKQGGERRDQGSP